MWSLRGARKASARHRLGYAAAAAALHPPSPRCCHHHRTAAALPPPLSLLVRRRTHLGNVLRRILEAQCALLSAVGAKESWTPQDFGFTKEVAGDAQVFTGSLPSIKKSHGSIMAASPKKGPTMHDTPPKNV